MRLLTWNVNGIRAAQKQGLTQWIGSEQADIICLQEIKAHPDQLDEALLRPRGYESFWSPAKKRGYSGVAIYSKKEPTEVLHGVGVPEIDDEGRVLTLRFQDFSLVNLYFPNSQRDHARLPFKLVFCDTVFKYLEKEKNRTGNLIICGDFNIAHREIDLRNPKSNEKNAGFLPQERAWLDRFLAHDYLDTFRVFETGPDHYTWWSYRPGVRAKNIGWRLDYFMVNFELKRALKTAWHQPHIYGSDHCPVGLEVKL